MKFRSHFTELHYRFSFLTITWLTTFVISYTYSDTAAFYLLQSNLPNFHDGSNYFITTQLTEIFSVHVKLSIFIANQLSWFAFVYVLVSFSAPGLYKHEIALALDISKVIFSTWVVTVVIFHVILMPALWGFFLNLNSNNTSIFFEARFFDYFDAFIFIYSLLNLGIISLVFFLYSVASQVLKIRKLRKFFYFFSFSLAAVLTPPDIMSQILVAAVLLFLVEIYAAVSIFVISK